MGNSPAKILLVEDEPSIVELITLTLEKRGYRVVNVVEGTSVMEKVRQEKPDLIILDVMIPKLNGFEVCQKIKLDPDFKSIPVMILSALVQKGEIETGLRMGADIYLTKPFQNKELLENIEQLLRKKTV